MYKMNVDVLELVKKLEIALKMLMFSNLTSTYRSVFRGQGLDFEDYREYSPGDDSKRIDWKASVRSNQVLVKEFTEERDMDAYFLVDASSSMVFGSGDKLKNEYAAEVAASLGHFILVMGDRVGKVMFNDRIVHTLSSGSGNDQFYLLMRSLVDPSLYGGGYDLQNAIDYMMKSMSKRGLLFILSDFIGLREGWVDAVRAATGKFDVVGIMVRDPRDIALPEHVGEVVISDPYSSKTMMIDPDEIGIEYERYARLHEERVRKGFLSSNADFISLRTDKPFIMPMINFFRRREASLHK